MKTLRILSLTFFTFVCPVFVYPQDSHVHTQYANNSNKTAVQTDWIYLLNTPQQFLELILNTQYTGQRLKNPPEKIDLLIWSFSREAIYKENKYQKLQITTDGEQWSIDAKTYLAFKGETTKDGLDIFWEEKRPLIGQPGRLPPGIQVKGEQGINGLFMEQFYYQLKLDQLLKISTAKTVEAQLGGTKLSFSINQMNIIRSFLSQIQPSFRYEQNRTESAQQAPTSPEQKIPYVVETWVINGKALNLPQPDYPPFPASIAGGVVEVLVIVDETGKVTAAKAITGHRLLRDAAESAARQARFAPTIIAGQAIKITGTIMYVPRKD